ncbi:MAG: transketolase [Candidatus Babeliales bacterium]
MDFAQKDFLERTAYNTRVSSILSTTQAGSGHPTTCLSAADLVAVLFFYTMQFDPEAHANPNNDRFILSKGHAAPLLYAIYKELGLLSEKELLSLRKFNSVLEGHPTARFSYSEAATGSLGQGLSIGAGIALSAKMDKRSFRTYVLMGDSEVAEGSVWEAAMIAAHYKLDNLIAILDVNKLGQSTETMEGYHLEHYQAMFASFGWHALVVDGHNIVDIAKAFDQAKKLTGKPIIIIAKTIKGYGIKSIEGKQGYHGKAFSKEELPGVLQELHDRFGKIADAQIAYTWKAQYPKDEQPVKQHKPMVLIPHFKKGELIATRKAYGLGLVELGKMIEMVISLDAEVKNSTFAELFEKQFPDRFVQCFIAEQNMVSMGVGFASRGKIPFISTFACFLTRAYDQIRMAAIGQAPLRIVGSHAGVSIGEDGPSQMGLEDIAMMRAIPNSIILYPADAVGTYKMLGLMANYTAGISYMRTTRAATPVMYDNDQQFSVGGCHIVRQSGSDKACIIAAGITLFEALKAYDILHAQKIHVAVIDAYSIKPLAQDVIERVVKKSCKRVVTVEDHYRAGGLGEAVASALINENVQVKSLAVDHMPRSGTPEELFAYEELDAAAIVRAVKELF